MNTAVRIRMYRPGFGDCFLVSFFDEGGQHHGLIDFGAHMHGEIGTMDDIMDDIESETGKKLAFVVATHAHRDHISGFGKFAARFSKFSIGEVWLPWTDNPKDPDARTFTKKHLALYETLLTHLRLAFGATPQNPGAFAMALDALSNLAGNQKATSELARGFETGAAVRYLQANDKLPKAGGVEGLSAEIRGPSRDKSFLTRMDPPSDQHFMTAPGEVSNSIRPFPPLEIKKDDQDYQAIVQLGQPVLDDKQLEVLHGVAEAPAERLALVLDNVRNNTSLVIVFRYQGRTMLFPGDAQWGNWQSWISTKEAKDLLGEIDFLKMAHHGSENATPVDVVNALRAEGLAAVVPTQIKPFPTIPRMPLLAAVEKRCVGHVAVRSDWIDVNGAPSGPSPVPELPKNFKAGKLWIDYEL